MLSLNANDLALADLGYTGVQVMQALVSLGSSIKICLCRWLICVLVLVSTRQSWISAAVWPHVWHVVTVWPHGMATWCGYMVWLHGMATWYGYMVWHVVTKLQPDTVTHPRAIGGKPCVG